MPFDMKKPAAMPMPPPDDPEESGEQDAISAALDSIRAAVDEAEKTLMLGKKDLAQPEPGEGE